MNPGVRSLSAPVFDHADRLAGAMTVLGALGSFDLSLDAAAAVLLKQKTSALSHRLGRRNA